MTRIVHIRREPYQVYIGRPSKWHNPYSSNPYAAVVAENVCKSLSECLRKYEEYIKSKPELIEEARVELEGKVLGCYCKPEKGFNGQLRCHGQILAGLIEGVDPREIK